MGKGGPHLNQLLQPSTNLLRELDSLPDSIFGNLDPRNTFADGVFRGVVWRGVEVSDGGEEMRFGFDLHWPGLMLSWKAINLESDEKPKGKRPTVIKEKDTFGNLLREQTACPSLLPLFLQAAS